MTDHHREAEMLPDGRVRLVLPLQGGGTSQLDMSQEQATQVAADLFGAVLTAADPSTPNRRNLEDHAMLPLLHEPTELDAAHWADQLAAALGQPQHRVRTLVDIATRTHRGDVDRALRVTERALTDEGGATMDAYRRLLRAGSPELRQWRGDGSSWLASIPVGSGSGQLQPEQVNVTGLSLPLLWRHAGGRLGHTTAHQMRGLFLDVWFECWDPALVERLAYQELSASPSLRTGDHRLVELSLCEPEHGRIAGVEITPRAVPEGLAQHRSQPDQWNYHGPVRTRTTRRVENGRTLEHREQEIAGRAHPTGPLSWPTGEPLQLRATTR